VLCQSPMVLAAFHKDYLKERTWIEIREEPPKSPTYGFASDDFNGTRLGAEKL